MMRPMSRQSPLRRSAAQVVKDASAASTLPVPYLYDIQWQVDTMADPASDAVYTPSAGLQSVSWMVRFSYG